MSNELNILFYYWYYLQQVNIESIICIKDTFYYQNGSVKRLIYHQKPIKRKFVTLYVKWTVFSKWCNTCGRTISSYFALVRIVHLKKYY